MTRELAWRDYVALVFEELVTLGSSSPVVARRLLAALDDLISVAPPDRRPPLETQRRRLLSGADEAGIAVGANGHGTSSKPPGFPLTCR